MEGAVDENGRFNVYTAKKIEKEMIEKFINTSFIPQVDSRTMTPDQINQLKQEIGKGAYFIDIAYGVDGLGKVGAANSGQ
jgi:hypothetical protein